MGTAGLWLAWSGSGPGLAAASCLPTISDAQAGPARTVSLSLRCLVSTLVAGMLVGGTNTLFAAPVPAALRSDQRVHSFAEQRHAPSSRMQTGTTAAIAATAPWHRLLGSATHPVAGYGDGWRPVYESVAMKSTGSIDAYSRAGVDRSGVVSGVAQAGAGVWRSDRFDLPPPGYQSSSLGKDNGLTAARTPLTVEPGLFAPIPDKPPSGMPEPDQRRRDVER